MPKPCRRCALLWLTSAQQQLAHAMSEAELAGAVEDAFTRFGWRWVHFRPARKQAGWATAMSGHPGSPDYMIARNDELLFIELKSQHGRLTADQEAWGAALDNLAGQTGGRVWYGVWRPSHWLGGHIEAVLK